MSSNPLFSNTLGRLSVSKEKETPSHKKIRLLRWLVLTACVFLGYSLQSVTGNVYYSIVMRAHGTVASSPVVLGEGTAGNSIIYTNNTSAKVWTGTGDFNYVLNLTESQGFNWKVRLSAFDQSNIDRLYNCSIYIYDGSNSTQILISNGVYSQPTGPWYDLAASGTDYIWMHVETSSAGTSYVYAYLEILTPETTTYARYVITFEIL